MFHLTIPSFPCYFTTHTIADALQQGYAWFISIIAGLVAFAIIGGYSTANARCPISRLHIQYFAATTVRHYQGHQEENQQTGSQHGRWRREEGASPNASPVGGLPARRWRLAVCLLTHSLTFAAHPRRSPCRTSPRGDLCRARVRACPTRPRVSTKL